MDSSSDVQFEEEDMLTIARPIPKKKKNSTSLIARIAISTGLAKDEKDAQKVLLVLAVVMLVFAVGFYVFGNNLLGTTPTLTPQQESASFTNGG